MEPGKIDPVVHYIPHAAYAGFGLVTSRCLPRLEARSPCEREIAELSAIPYLRVYGARLYRPRYKSIAGEYVRTPRAT